MKYVVFRRVSFSLLAAIAIFWPGLVAAATRPVGFGGKAFEVQVSDAGEATLKEVGTRYPVLAYLGDSADRSLRAYTTLEALDEGQPNSRRRITAEELANDSSLRLVPSGELYTEKIVGGWARKVSLPGHYVVAASWSPRDAAQLAYTFSSGSDFGLALVDLRSGKVKVLRSANVLADYIGWNPKGDTLQFYEELPSEGALGDLDPEPPALISRAVAISTGRVLAPDPESDGLPRLRPAKELPERAAAFTIPLKGGLEFQGDNLYGFSELALKDQHGVVLGRFAAHVVSASFPNGVVVKRFDEDGDHLLFIGTSNPPIALATRVTVTYKFPLPALSTSGDLTVTQVGTSFTTKCNVYSHTGASSYAYDIQTKAGNEAVLASADGTVAYVYKTVTCNSLDTVGCSDYRSTCADNGHWGNVVILQHADGTWTKATHLKYGTVLPSTIGRSASVGCQMATQGHTGWTTGDRNGCGDHVHFARQSSSSRDGISISISISGATNPLSCKSYESATTKLTPNPVCRKASKVA